MVICQEFKALKLFFYIKLNFKCIYFITLVHYKKLIKIISFCPALTM